MRLGVRRVLCVLLLLLGGAAAQGQDNARMPVLVMRFDGAISPASSDYLQRGLAMAESRHAQLVVLQIDTPGGLDTSMRSMIKDILASPIPIATFVAPGGARAASAGTYILYASHVAAMTPASNLGAATPIELGAPGAPPAPPRPNASAASAPAETDHMAAKRISDASAYIRSLAQLRGRNADWGEKAVRDAVSLSAGEALRLKVVDVVATDVPDLLRQLDGRELRTSAGVQKLHTRDAPVVAYEQDWRSRLLTVIANPSLALLLLTVGIYALVFEFSTPGLVAPGVIGAICVLLGLFALQMLPVNHAGLALMLLGIAFLIAEVFLPSYGALGLGGVVAFALGAVTLIDTGSPGWGVPLPLVALLTIVTAVFVVGVVGMAVRARRRPVVTGPGTLVSQSGRLVEYEGGEGWVLVAGEHWRARGPVGLQAGDSVRVTAVRDGLLEVTGA